MNNDANSKKFRDLAEKNVSPKFIEAKTYKVKLFEEGNLFNKYVSIEQKALEYAISRKGQQSSYTDDLLRKFPDYCKALVASRVDYVLGGRPVVKPMDHVMVPSFLMNIIMQIGEVMDLSTGIRLLPEEVDTPSISLDEMREISMLLESIREYEGGFGYPKDKSGSWEFMTMWLVGTQLQRFSADAHPVYALMASVIGLKQIESVLNPLVTYGDTNLFEGLLWQLTSI